MRVLLIGLSLATTVLASPTLASNIYENNNHEQRLVLGEAGFDDSAIIIVPSKPTPEPQLIKAIIRYYTIPQMPTLRKVDFISSGRTYDNDAVRMIPATHYRIKVFRDQMQERFGELSTTNWV